MSLPKIIFSNQRFEINPQKDKCNDGWRMVKDLIFH